MALELIECIGIYFAKKTINNAYNTTYNILFGSESHKINKKLDTIINQNENLKKEIYDLKNNISNNNTTIIYQHCELKLIDNYINIIPYNNNMISKSLYINKQKKKITNLSKSCHNIIY